MKIKKIVVIAAVLSVLGVFSLASVQAEVRGKYLAVPAAVVPAGQAFDLSWQGTPGNAQDWVTVVPVGTPDNQWGTWTYLQGQTAGVFRVNALQPGNYEARLYYNWPTGGFQVIERLSFQVGQAQAAPPVSPGPTGGAHLVLPGSVLPAGQAFDLRWQGTPGNAQDWVTVVPVGTPDNQWGTWTYLQGQTAGVFRVNALQPGNYEARLYYNWPAGGFQVIERLTFRVQ